ncbi:hypothetical protein HPP92_026913 [Vanilla planifolia]|uniref:Uncharacterized protein n=1 Tax=Vanilla planifolia TaxID=51239 RepID=A0A835PB85_VANPL|nr:hypothetical protein HPP92_026913 [Vanilla planifolia]
MEQSISQSISFYGQFTFTRSRNRSSARGSWAKSGSTRWREYFWVENGLDEALPLNIRYSVVYLDLLLILSWRPLYDLEPLKFCHSIQKLLEGVSRGHA